VVVTAEQSQALLVVDVAGRARGAGDPDRAARHAHGRRGADGGARWTANIGSGSVTLVDLARGDTVRTRAPGRGPEAIDVSPDGREVWAADRQLDRITVLDATTLDSLGVAAHGRFPNRSSSRPTAATCWCRTPRPARSACTTRGRGGSSPRSRSARGRPSRPTR
jgi:DNA-binding beta-propeller fold protein YncE